MADTKISALTDGSPLATGDIIPIDRAGANFRVTYLDQYIVCAADQTINNSNVLTNDTYLSWSISTSATETWFFEAYLVLTAPSTASDWQFGMAGPTGATALWGAFDSYINQAGFDPATTSGSPLSMLAIGGTLAVGSGNTTQGLHIGGWVYGGGTSGTLNIKWAQNTATAVNSVRKAGSFMRVTKVVS